LGAALRGCVRGKGEPDERIILDPLPGITGHRRYVTDELIDTG